ncbi:MAG: hypothetical protein FWE61_04030 [Micrococcales bacterium]|nr:hypothetical protein [Micrococcales bacterium]
MHPDLDCLVLAQRRKAFGRALRHAGPLDTTAFDDAVAQVVARSGAPGTHDGPGPPGRSRQSNQEAG